MSFRRGWVLFAALLLAGACTSADEIRSDNDEPVTFDRSEQGVTDSIAASLTGTPENLNFWLAPADEAKCAAQRLVSRIGADRLLELGYDPNKPTLKLEYAEEERAAATNVLVGCIDFERAVLSLVSSSQKLSLEASSCISRGYERLHLTRDLAASLVTGTDPDPLAQDARFSRAVGQLAVDCLGVDDMLPNAPLPRLPGGSATTTTAPASSTTEAVTTTTVEDSGSLNGIEPGSPLDSGN
jgi:hypothetical protein